MAGVGRIQALCWSAVAVALFCAAPAFADDPATEDDSLFGALETVAEDELREQSGGTEIAVDGDLGLNIGITDGSITDSSADNTVTGNIVNNPIQSNRGINLIDLNTGANVIIQKNANVNVFVNN